MTRALAPLLAVLIAAMPACDRGTDDEDRVVETPGPLMRAGWNCLASGCHFPDKLPTPPDWSAAGTVFPRADAKASRGLADVLVIIRDAKAKEVRLVTNTAGNFYTREPLEGPLDVRLEYQGRSVKMPMPAPAGSCNFCHSFPAEPGIGTKGRIFAP